MGIVTRTVKLHPRGTAIAYYKGKGYDAKYGQELEVKVEDLQLCSTVLVDTVCDYCGEPKEPQKYVTYNAQTKNGTEKCCCINCAQLKRGESMVKKYGYEFALQVPEFKKKVQETNLDRYGSISPSGNIAVRDKQKQTNLEKYGVESPSMLKEVQDKRKQTNLEKYGVENVLLNVDIIEKIKRTNIERYGVENVSKNKDIQNKRMQTFIERFGVSSPLQNKECLEKLKLTNMERYGVECVLKLADVKEKAKHTNLERYGYENPMQSPELLEVWLANNGSDFVKSSKQQKYLCDLYNGVLNHPFKCFAFDIYLDEDKLDIEFDGSGHKMSIALGTITAEEFKNKELYRNVAIKKAGIKQMRIISTKDKLPSDQILLQMLSDARQYFSDFPNHSWIEFNIDNLTLCNAENKNGVPYNYGELRTIKTELRLLK